MRKLNITILAYFVSLIAHAQWTNISPNVAGRMSSILADRTNPNVLLASSPGGGIWKTLNNGINWAPTLNHGLSDFCVSDLQWDKVQTNRILACTKNALYASTDFGDNWVCLTSTCANPPLIHINRENFDRKLFAQLTYTNNPTSNTIFWCSARNGIYFSNNGSAFTQHFPFPDGVNNPDNEVSSITIDNLTGYVYFASSNIGPFPPRVFRSEFPWTDTTTTMNWYNVFIPTTVTYKNVTCITSTGIANKLALAIQEGIRTMVYKTVDGSQGLMWEQTASQPDGITWDPRVISSPSPNQLLLGTASFRFSNDFGDTWDSIPYLSAHPDINSFHWASYPTGSYLWFTTDGSVYANSLPPYGAILRFNFMPSSTPTSAMDIPVNGLKTWQTYYTEVYHQKGTTNRKLFIGSHDNGAYISNDNGATWQKNGIPISEDNYLMKGANTDWSAYATNGSTAGAQRTLDATLTIPTWNDILSISASDPLFCGSQMISIDPTNSQRFAIIQLSNVILSTDGGTTSGPLGQLPINPIPDNGHTYPYRPSCVYLDTDGTIYVGTIDGGIFSTTDNGITWIPFALNTNSPRLITKILHTDYDKTTFYFATSNGLYRRLKGQTDETLITSYGYTVSDIEVHPTQSNKIFIAYGNGGTYIRHYGGVSYSNDAGTTFTSISSGYDIHLAPISDIKIDPLNYNLIYVATYGLGVWKYQF